MPWLVALVCLGCALRLTGLEVHSLWFDEVATVQTVESADLLRALEGDRHPPLSFLALRAWSAAFGFGDATLRLLPALLSCVALAILATVARRLLAPLACAGATALWAVAPFHVWIAQEVRMYAFLELFAVGALGACLLAPPRLRAALLVACGAFALGTHYLGVLVVPLVAGVGAVRALAGAIAPRRAWLDAVAVAAGGLLWAPWWVLVLPAQMETDWGYQARLAPRELVELPVRQVLTELDAVPAPLRPGLYALAAVLLAGLAANLVRAVRLRREPDAVPAVAWIAPIAGALALGLVLPPNFGPRYVLVASPGVVLAVAAGLGALPWRPLRAPALAAAVLGSLAVTAIHRGANYREDFRSACAEIRTAWHPGDAVLAVTGTPPPTPRAALEHYLRDAPDVLAAAIDWGDVGAVRGRLHVVLREAHYTQDREAALRRGFAVVEETPSRHGVVRLLLEPR